jgi:surfeit locus 1 family protein
VGRERVSDVQTTERPVKVSPASRFRWPAVTTFFNRQWWWTTLLVLAAMGVLVRLGIWQLDRREQRRVYNAQIIQQLALPPLSLNDEVLPADLTELRNRQATVRGEYDFSGQVALTQQHWNDSPGFHLITPLVIQDEARARSGDQRAAAVLVDRGWLPAGELAPENWSQYDVPGPVDVTGYIKLSQTVDGAAQASVAPQAEWYRVDVEAIQAQMPYELLPIYLQQVPPVEGSTALPFRGELEPDLSEGPHLSYAIQWFIFTTILGVGYVYFVGKKPLS